jgi:hypothetical protein
MATIPFVHNRHSLIRFVSVQDAPTRATPSSGTVIVRFTPRKPSPQITTSLLTPRPYRRTTFETFSASNFRDLVLQNPMPEPFKIRDLSF